MKTENLKRKNGMNKNENIKFQSREGEKEQLEKTNCEKKK